VSAPLRSLQVRTHAWPLKEPFAIARGVRDSARVVIVELRQGQAIGRGEAGGIAYHGETAETMQAQLEAVRDAVEAGCHRHDLLPLLPAGGARHALDAALWDLQAKLTATPAWRLAGTERWQPIASAVTIGIRDVAAYAAAARERAGFPWLKVKVGAGDPVPAIAAVRHGAPHARLIVDANQAWTVDELRQHAIALAPFHVDLLEQPVPAGQDIALEGFDSPIPLCADEAFSTLADLPDIARRYQFVNIKLDKAGGLTSALELASAARAAGLRLMVGCMLGGSISVAPATILAQGCEVCDLDGPWLQAQDWPDGVTYHDGLMQLPTPALWG
jgi:L-alanine-DL-glutamate epimerase-like enolase superfamily enzyme